MSCKLVRRHLGAFVDGELDPATQIEFERHLEACPGCQEHLAFESSLRQQTRDSIGGIHAPEHLWGRRSIAWTRSMRRGRSTLR